MERDFVISGLHGLDAPQAEPLQTARRTREALARKHRRRAQVDFGALVRDVLTALRASVSPGERALLVVHVLGWLEVEDGAQLAQVVATRLTPVELQRIGRAGLLSLTHAAAHLDPAWRETVQALLAPALAARPRATRKLVGEVLLCTEGVERTDVARAVLHLRTQPASPSVLFVAAVDDESLTRDEWVSLLTHEARLTGDVQLSRYAALAQRGQVRLVAETALPAPTSVLLRLARRVRTWFENELYGDAAVPSRRHLTAG